MAGMQGLEGVQRKISIELAGVTARGLVGSGRCTLDRFADV